MKRFAALVLKRLLVSVAVLLVVAGFVSLMATLSVRRKFHTLAPLCSSYGRGGFLSSSSLSAPLVSWAAL
jgi:hypothetical protein